MSTSKLSAFRHVGLTPTWSDLLEGRQGLKGTGPLISPAEVVSHAQDELASDDRDEVALLAALAPDQVSECDDLLRRVTNNEPVGPNPYLRWAVVLLSEVLAGIPGDPIYGLLELTDFWQQFDYPDYMPHTVQGRFNSLSPEEYFTEDNYQHLLALHRDWLASTLVELRGQ